MATNFPDTSGVNPNTGVLWADGDSYPDPQTGLTYYWYSPVWKTAISPTGATDDRYVEVAGDNMTGDLTLGPDGGPALIDLGATTGSANFEGDVTVGTDKITLDATTGNAIFTGNCNAADLNCVNLYTSTEGHFGAANQVEINKGGFYAGVLGNYANNGVKISLGDGGSLDRPEFAIFYDDDSVVSLKGDGSASFAGEVTMGIGGAPYTTNTVTVNSAGYIWAQRDGSNVWVGADGTGTSTSSINSDGSGRFDGLVTFNGGTIGATGRAIELNGDIGIQLEPDNDDNYTVTTDVDEEGNTVETRTYTGPTLDVKAVLQDLQQRVNDRDAVIADLTTRIAALEAA